MQNGSSVRAVLMAGGPGLRLRPLTLCVPKPLLPLNGEPLLVHIIRRLSGAGIHDIHVALGYLGRVTRAFLETAPSPVPGVQVSFLEEGNPLGTAGPLQAFKGESSRTTIVHNGDIVCNIDFRALLAWHRAEKCAITVVSVMHTTTVPFGVLDVTENRRLRDWREKVRATHEVSAGIYVVEPESLDLIPSGTPFDMPDLVGRCLSENLRVGVHRHEGRWIDVGSLAQYEKAARSLLAEDIQLVESAVLDR